MLYPISVCVIVSFLAGNSNAGPVSRVTYNGTAEIRTNPERGFRFEVDNGCDEGSITDHQLDLITRFNLSVVQTYCYLPSTPVLPPSSFAAIAQAFARLKSVGAKALLRFACVLVKYL